MIFCPFCNKKSIYTCFDKINSWCRNGCGSFANLDGILFYLGKDIGTYPVRPDGTIIKIKRKEEVNKVTIEEERLIELESKLKQFIKERKENKDLIYESDSWWFKLSNEDKIKVYKNRGAILP